MMHDRTHGLARARLSRRAALAAFAGATLLPLSVAAQDEPSSGAGRLAEVPSSGGRRPGPVGGAAGTRERREVRTFTPVELVIPDAGVDAPVEVGQITPDGVMQDPTGSWVVAWYDDISAPGEGTNVVMSGHLDYWDVGPAVFWNVPNLAEGARMSLVMEEGETYEYALEWSRLYNVAEELTPEVIQTEVVGDTGHEALTLITCGGEFDYAAGHYLNRWVLRASKV